MHHINPRRWLAITVVAVMAGLLAPSARGQAATLTGEASAVRATTLGWLGGATTTVLAGTGTLSGPGDARDASLVTGSIGPLVSAEVLDAVTMGWPDQVTSTASLSNLDLAVGGTGITADMVTATATALAGSAGGGSALVENLAINGVRVPVTGLPNQTVPIPGGQVVINEQLASPGGTTVNALHATVVGVADVVVGSATAGIR